MINKASHCYTLALPLRALGTYFDVSAWEIIGAPSIFPSGALYCRSVTALEVSLK